MHCSQHRIINTLKFLLQRTEIINKSKGKNYATDIYLILRWFSDKIWIK